MSFDIAKVAKARLQAGKKKMPASETRRAPDNKRPMPVEQSRRAPSNMPKKQGPPAPPMGYKKVAANAIGKSGMPGNIRRGADTVGKTAISGAKQVAKAINPFD